MPLAPGLAGLWAPNVPAGALDGLVGSIAVKATLILLIGFGVAPCLARAPAAVRHRAWCVTLAGLLLLPALASWVPGLSLTVLPTRQAQQIAAPALLAAGPSAGSAEGAEVVADPVAPGVPRASGSAHARRWSRVLGGTYLSGLVALFALLVVGDLRARRLARGALRLDQEPGWRDLVTSLRETYGIARPVSVLATDRVAVPVAWGLRRPTVLLPADAREWGEGQRRDVLLHELAHVSRHDWSTQLLARVVRALYWFHPLVWVAARRLAFEAERSCDDRVLGAGSDCCDYAERLVRVAAGARERRDPPLAAVALARRGHLETRIAAILDDRVRRGTPKGLPALLLAAAILVPAGVIATVRLAPVAESVEGSPNRIVPGDGTPLIDAARRGDPERARALLVAGAEPDLWAEGDESPLFHAVVRGDLAMARLLLDAGADPNALWPGDGSPLIVAAARGRLPMVELLLEAGADVDRAVRGDENPLIRAAAEGHLEVAQFLLDAGADPNVEVVDR